MGTAKILALSLANCVTFVGEDFSEHLELNRLLSEEHVEHFVLYPSDSSQGIEAVCGAKKKVRVILLDGTWKKAFKIWQVSSNLHHLPALHLPKDLKGNYRIRKAPSENSLSTVEAGFHLLSAFEQGEDYSPLMTAFDKMIQFQIDQMPPGIFEKNYLA